MEVELLAVPTLPDFAESHAPVPQEQRINPVDHTIRKVSTLPQDSQYSPAPLGQEYQLPVHPARQSFS
ncbi:MAG: hypothetical protein ACRDTC_16940, partial [Pseudonocardiaceae bacterium]